MRQKQGFIHVTNATLSDHTITSYWWTSLQTYVKVAHLVSLFSKHNEERRSRPTHNWWTLILVSWSLQKTITHVFKTIIDENHNSMSKLVKPPLLVIPDIQSSTFQLISFYWPKSFQSAVTFYRNVKFIWGNQETQSDWVWNDNFVWDLKTKLIFRFLLN